MSNIFQNIVSDNTFLGLNRIYRWMGEETIKKETVGGHSFDVVLIVRLIVEEIFPEKWYKEKLEVITDASVHDFDEVFSGDVTHKVKYNSFNGDKIKSALEDFCNHRLNEYFADPESKSAMMFLEATTNKSAYSKDIIKVADWISMSIFCKKEVDLGNSRFTNKKHHCIQSLIEACDKVLESDYGFKFEDGESLDLSIFNQIKKLNWT